MAEIINPSDNLYDQLGALKAYAVDSQHIINGLGGSPADKRALLQGVLQDLDEQSPIIQTRVYVAGTAVKTYLALNERSIPLEEENVLSYNYHHAVEPGEAQGISAGYGAKEVDYYLDGEVVDSRMVICHMIHTGQYVRQYDREGNCVDTQSVMYFAVEESELHVIEDRGAHDIRQLRRDDDPLYKAVDITAYDDNLELGEKLRQINAIAETYKFGSMNIVKQQRLVSYLNSLGLLKTLNHVRSEYAITSSANGCKVIVLGHDVPVFMTFEGFTVSQKFRLLGEFAVESGLGISIKAQAYDEYQKAEMVLPINQRLVIG